MAAPGERTSLLKDFIKSRWTTMAASLFIMACNGTVYAFGIYSQTMKLTLGYNQEQITTIGFYKDLGGNLGIVSGVLQDFTGAWSVILLGSILNVVGSIMIWLGITERIAPPTVWQMSLYHFICFNATAFVNTGVIVTGIKNFPGNRGFVLGLLKGFIGLSGAILAQVYHAIYGNNPSSFVLLIMWLPTIVFLSFMFLIRRRPPTNEGNETRRFNFLLGTSLFLAAFLLVVILVQKLSTVTRKENEILAAVALFILLFPLGVVLHFVIDDRKARIITTPRKAAINEAKAKNLRDANNISEKGIPSAHKIHSLPASTPALTSHSNATTVEQLEVIALAKGVFGGFGEKINRGENHTVLQALFKIDFWLLFTISTCALGTGLMAIDNIGQFGSALGASSLQTSTFVSLVSIWNFIGRVSSGFVSEFCLHRYSIPRPVFFALPLAVGCIGHLLFAFAVPGALNVGSIIIGFCYGFQAPILFIIVSEIFGLTFFGTLYNLATMSLPLGTELMSVLVGGKLYDREAQKQHRQQHMLATAAGHIAPSPSPAAHPGQSKALVCVGKQCYQNAFLIMAGVSAFGCILGIILTIRTRAFYKMNAARLTNAPEQSLDLQLPNNQEVHQDIQ
ncbi:hypothetical protein O6H91_18G036800 [Diphasiastrum complanatum]|uniref:Uncharacterized protein n=6 Tax=Diphasiastrum complanatum TaxID=34168 RepID=A0ACC2AZX3_DIPCM|nr:hypothetical protein O6H91_18G036800 [Diphasiastrum complanatum]KAJ7523084.1 hypothetical protein O6H91_18G036800 [Diphasiastrum complanatum]KAJ7523085.1 hypothetical protein O6H91_18G036800 [Diphasiastrum complanatum]KAJ7523086.1 hypothetical protein O6H91_18G036800 [Diphasiastrum complanatum]KAJ7523087.1 hypothetical protein O6H91_18G036800 [Diphasiastrum complanatum]